MHHVVSFVRMISRRFKLSRLAAHRLVTGYGFQSTEVCASGLSASS